MSSYEVKGKYAIVTGAGSGLNLAFAEQLLEKGCSVMLADLKLRPEAGELVLKYASTEAGKPSAIFQQVDLADWGQINSLWKSALEEFPQIDLVCNGAGIYEPPESCFWNPPGISPLAQDKEDENPGQYKSFAVNTAAPIRIAQIAIDYWLQNRHIQGNIIWVASLGAYVHGLHVPIYLASKAAIVSFVRSVAVLNKHFGIRNTAICPGRIHTPLFGDRATPGELGMEPAQCASVMMRLITEPQYGDGNIVEAMMVGTKEDSKINVREVPMEALYPTVATFSDKNYVEREDEKVLRQLQERGMR